jgi:hypothetical protein
MIKTDNIWITFRNSFTFLNLSLVVAVGLSSYLLNKTIRQVVIVLGIYFIFALPFFHNYFYRYPLLTAKDIFFYNRVVASYIQRQPEQKFVIFSATPKTLFDSLMAYNQLFKDFSQPEISTAYSQENFELGNIKVVGKCFEPDWIATQSGTTVLVDYQVQPCTTSSATNSGQIAKISISSIIDSGAVYRLFNESYCASQSLPGYIRITKNVLAVENLIQTEFCQSFFTSWK